MCPEINATFEGYNLIKNKDYVLHYTKNIEPGTATIIVEGIGNFKNNREIIFDIYRVVEIPQVIDNLFYNGKLKKGVLDGEFYTVVDNCQTCAGNYTATASLNESRYAIWTDEITKPKLINWSINKAMLKASYISEEIKLNKKTGIKY